MIKKCLLLIGAILIIAFLTLPVLIRSSIEKALKNYWPAARVAVSSLRVESGFRLILEGLSVEGDSFSIHLKKISMGYGRQLVIDGLEAAFRSWLELPDSGGGASLFVPKSIELKNISVRYGLEGLTGGLEGSAKFDMASGQIVYAHFKSASIKKGDMALDNTALDIEGAQGLLSAESFKYGKFKVRDLKAVILLNGRGVLLKPISAKLLGGEALGYAVITLEAGWPYRAEFDIKSVALTSFIQDFELASKLTAEGILHGKIVVIGDRGGVTELVGGLASSEQGGDLVIQDKAFLQNIADRVRQPIELVEAGLKEYHFDTANLALRRQDKNLETSIDLNGPKGKRNFDINLHDVF